jgi:hypothetical protein
MTRSVLWVVALSLVVTAAPVRADLTGIEKTLFELDQRRMQAMVDADEAVLDRVLAEDLSYTHSNGAVQTKSELMGSLTSGRIDYRMLRVDPERARVRVYGDTSVMTGTVHIQAAAGEKSVDAALRYTSVYVRSDGNWRLAAWHSTRIPPASKGDEEAGIRGAVLDYCEGWYEGDPARMERCLHPELAKRIVRTNEDGRSRLDQMGAMRLVQYARAGYGKKTPPEEQQKDIDILDVYGNVATARATMAGWIDYLHLARVDGEWRIINVLWEYKPGE